MCLSLCLCVEVVVIIYNIIIYNNCHQWEWYLPLHADGHQRQHGSVKGDNQHEAVDLAQERLENPAFVHHELHDLGNPEDHDDEVSDGQIADEEIGHRRPHLAVADDGVDDQTITGDADDPDQEEQEAEADDFRDACREGSGVLRGVVRRQVLRGVDGGGTHKHHGC